MTSDLKPLKDRKIYGNWRVLSPDGILMFRCELKKANWYLSRHLAEIVSEHTIQLKFNPKGLGNHNKGYGLHEMQNRCVNCGSEHYLTRHHVVPISYRKHFPLEMKSHNFHDVLSMCVKCHEEYERKADLLKSELAQKYNAPIGGVLAKVDNIKIIKNAATLLDKSDLIPEHRVKVLKEDIRNYLGRDFTKEDLEQIASVKKQVVVESHGEIVMRQISDIPEFVLMWRKHFVENNKLDYLPENWRVENKIILDEHK